MQTAQINLKIDPQLKKKSQAVAKKLGLNLSNVLRELLGSFVEKEGINFSAKQKRKKRMSGEILIKEMIATGYPKKYAEGHGCAYENLLKEEKEGTLIRVM